MAFLRVALIGALVCAGSCFAAAADSSDEQAIKDVFAAFSASWNQPGMPGFGDLFTADADFVVITGKWMKGRDEIVSYHKDLLGKRYNGSHSFMDSVTVRFLQSNLAIAHVASGATYTADGKEQKRTGLGTATMVKVNGKWLIAAFHNTLTSGPGYNWGSPPNAQQDKPTAQSGHHLVGCPRFTNSRQETSGGGLRNYRSQDFHCFAQGSRRFAGGKLLNHRGSAEFCYSNRRCCGGGWENMVAYVGITGRTIKIRKLCERNRTAPGDSGCNELRASGRRCRLGACDESGDFEGCPHTLGTRSLVRAYG